MSIAVCSGLAAINLTDSLLLQLLCASVIYCMMGWVTGLLKVKAVMSIGYKLY
jgi:hypothetical protein